MKNVARVVLIVAGIIWGLGFIGNKYILDSGWTDIQLLFVRFVSAFVIIVMLYGKRMVTANKGLIKQGLFLGIFLFLGFFFQTWGLVYTTASNNAIITAGYIVILPILVYVIDRVKIATSTIIAAVITMLGIGLISIDFSSFEIAIGDVLTFIGAIFWAVHIYFLGHMSRKHDLFPLLGYQLLTFSVLITTILLLTDGFPTITRGYDNQFNLWVIGLLLGFFCSFIAFFFQAFGQKHTNPAEAAILISTESVFGPIFAILIYGEAFSWFLLAGMVLVFLGIVLSETGGIPLKPKRRQ
jgi:drug/metabolite transporter (DMT)-like permease